MFGLSENNDLSFLTGKEVIQVCVGVYQTILAFDGDTSISLECDFQLTRAPGTKDKEDACSSSPQGILTLLGSKITDVTNEGGGTLTLQFSDGSTFRILDSNREYESYQIAHPAGIIVV